ncbi:hypothetical protein K439DRAFT_1617283 [Ramaria rubella]|nr:hypothetical protein K439DRAFT_1617283 [Ramaria rubella]
MHHMSDRLIGLIEDNATWKVVFGFEKGTMEAVPTGGKTCAAHCVDITRKLFDSMSGPWDDMEQPALATVVKNRISALKTLYIDCHQTMMATGMGLVEVDQTNEIIPGTELGNIWDKICKHCPYPVVERSAISHSSMDIDTSSLMRPRGQMGGDVPGTVHAKVDDGETGAVNFDLEPTDKDGEWDSHHGSPGFDLDPVAWDPSPPLEATPAPQAISVAPHKTPDTSTAGPQSNKCKTALEKAIDITTADWEAHAGLAEWLAESNAKARLDCECIKAHHNFAVEKLRIQAEMDKVKATQAHELEMLKLRLGVGSMSSIPLSIPSLPHIPSFSPVPTSFVNCHDSSPYDLQSDLPDESLGSADPTLLTNLFDYVGTDPGSSILHM